MKMGVGRGATAHGEGRSTKNVPFLTATGESQCDAAERPQEESVPTRQCLVKLA
jgi:hypothetical protein